MSLLASGCTVLSEVSLPSIGPTSFETALYVLQIDFFDGFRQRRSLQWCEVSDAQCVVCEGRVANAGRRTSLIAGESLTVSSQGSRCILFSSSLVI